MKEFIPIASRFIDLSSGFLMKRGGKLYGARIAYEVFGKLNIDHSNVILILTGLSADAHATEHDSDSTPGWWSNMLGPGKPIDTNRWYVICINSLGSCKGSTGPASVNFNTGKLYRLEFPDLSIEDIADSAAFTIRALGFKKLACIIGVSMGGMSALAFIARHPDLAQNHINICSAMYALPFTIAIRSLQREAIRLDPHWNQGDYNESYYPKQGMLIARKLGLITYRSGYEWEKRFGRSCLDLQKNTNKKIFDFEFQIESYLDFHAHRFISFFDPNSYLYLSRCMDWFEFSKSCDDSASPLPKINLKNVLVIGVKTDILFPIEQQQQIAKYLMKAAVNVEFLGLDSPQGHDAFLVDTKRFGGPIANFLSNLNQ